MVESLPSHHEVPNSEDSSNSPQTVLESVWGPYLED
jgi:hypothetical protein